MGFVGRKVLRPMVTKLPAGANVSTVVLARIEKSCPPVPM